MEKEIPDNLYIFLSQEEYPYFPEAENRIKQVSMEKLHHLYGSNIPKYVLDRYDYELKIIFENKCEDIYMLSYLIAQKATLDGETFHLRGLGSSSLIAYLLGISFINPLDYDIPFDTLYNIKGYFEPNYVFNFRKNYLEEIYQYLMNIVRDNIVFDRNSNKLAGLRIDILVSDVHQVLKELEISTGIKHTEIDINDKNILNLFCKNENGIINTDNIIGFDSDKAKRILEKIKPNKKEDLFKILSLIKGTTVWENNVEKLITEHSIDVLPCSREDIYNYLLSKEIKKDYTFKIMEIVSKGKKQHYEEEWNYYVNIMKQHTVPNWYINSLEKVSYMFPKAHCCTYTVMALWLAWYKTYYPKEFKEVIEAYKN